MEQAPHPPSGTSRIGDARSSARMEGGAPASLTDSSNLETIAARAVPVTNSSLDSATLTVLGGRYDILGEAGRGAMGQVYKARDRETGEIVALKLLKPEIASDPGMVERFKSELLFARKITHKNVCRVYEFNRVDRVAYTSMEFVEGESLRSVLKRFGSLTPRKGIDVALQMCAGLKEAHARGIVHRDLKPENVMIDVQGNVKVMDFGIARSMETLTSLTGYIVGTPAYMAPEQAAGKAVDYRADIYALGLMLYEMFTGIQPFQADNAVALAMKHIQEAPRPPREIESSVSEPMERAILKCLEKDPERRFPSISELEMALRSQLPASAADRSKTAFPLSASNVTSEAAVVAATTVSSAAPAPKASRAGLVAMVLVLGVVALGAGMFWRGRGPRGVTENGIQVSEVSSPPMPNVSAAVAHSSAPVTANESAKLETPAAPKPKKMAKSPRVDASVASPAHTNSASTITPVAPPVASEALSGAAGTTPAAPAAASSPDARPDSGSTAAPPGTGGGGYVWVSRFPREGGAQNAARRIEEMGLPVTIIPKHNSVTDGDFFVVLTGPYAASKIDGIVEQLKAKGFAQARPNKAIIGGANPGARPGPALAP